MLLCKPDPNLIDTTNKGLYYLKGVPRNNLEEISIQQECVSRSKYVLRYTVLNFSSCGMTVSSKYLHTLLKNIIVYKS